MPIDARIHDALEGEFVCYYEHGELPEPWGEWMEEDLTREATSSAARIRRMIGDALVSEAASLLRAASRERRGDLVREVEGWTRFAWEQWDETWAALRQILLTIADELSPAQAP